jgi:hypothetical protein
VNKPETEKTARASKPKPGKPKQGLSLDLKRFGNLTPAIEGAVQKTVQAMPAARGVDGRNLRRTGRDIQFGTHITPDLHSWLKITSAKKGIPIGALLEEMQRVYEEHEKGHKNS